MPSSRLDRFKRKFIPRAVRLFVLFPALLLARCGTDGEESPRLIRLADPERIESHNLGLGPGAVPMPGVGETPGRWDGRDLWHVFAVPFELNLRSPSKALTFPDPSVDEAGHHLVIRPGFGVARIVSVSPNARFLLECKGTFGRGSPLKASVAKLSFQPEFPEGNPAGVLRTFMKSFGQDRIEYKAEKEGGLVRAVVRTNAETRALIIMVFSYGEEGGRLDWVRLNRIDQRAPSPAAGEGPGQHGSSLVFSTALGGIIMPSLSLRPGVRITFKEIRLPERAAFQCNLGWMSGQAESMRVALTLVDRDGGKEELLDWRATPELNGWDKISLDLSRYSEQTVRFLLEADWGHTKDKGRSAPVAFCGAPMVFTRYLPGRARDPNVVLISLDTLRSDHLGCYGYPRPVSPNLNNLARQGALFRRAYAHAPFTLPSHASLFTGLCPSVHGAQDPKVDGLPDSVQLLTEVLARKGWVTGSFNGGGLVSHEFGFHRGFDLYCEVDPLGDRFLEGVTPNRNRLADGSKGSLDRALAWLGEVRDRSFFLFLHTFMVHNYQPPLEWIEVMRRPIWAGLEPGRATWDGIMKKHFYGGGISRKELAYAVDMYDAGIRTADEMIGLLVSRIRNMGLMKDTIIIVSSDHGEEFLDHGGILHGWTLYDELIHVPLIMVVPGLEGGRKVEEFVSHVDLMPTVMELLGIDHGGPRQGQSLVPLLEGRPWKPAPILSEVRLPGYVERNALIQDGWKLIQGETDPSMSFPAPSPLELFHIVEDPGEGENIMVKYPGEGERFDAVLQRTKIGMKRLREALGIGEGADRSISEELKDVLRQQGYM